jgi:hypothetical protein
VLLVFINYSPGAVELLVYINYAALCKEIGPSALCFSDELKGVFNRITGYRGIDMIDAEGCTDNVRLKDVKQRAG